MGGMRILFAGSLLLAQCTAGQIRIMEVMFNPDGPERTDEYVEMINIRSSGFVDLEGWKISDGSGTDQLVDAGEGLLLGPGQIGILLDADLFEDAAGSGLIGRIPESALIVTVDGSTIGSAGLSNSRAETVSLIRPDGTLSDSVTYQTTIPPGISWERISAEDHQWSAGETTGGTPGAVNSVSVRERDLVVADLRLLDTVSDMQESADTVLVRIRNVGRAYAGGALLSLTMESRDGRISRVADSVRISMESGDSLDIRFGWVPDCYGSVTAEVVCTWEPDQKPENNRLRKAIAVPYPLHALVINEIMADPLQNQPEWVEVYNRLSQPVDLLDWSVSDADTASRQRITGSAVLAPGAFAVLCADAGCSALMSGNGPLCVLGRDPGFNQDGDAVFLFGPASGIVDSMAYVSAWGGGDGVSLERIDIRGKSGDPANWMACRYLTGHSAGRCNSVSAAGYPDDTGLEIAPNPFSPDGDGKDEVALISVRAPAGAMCASLTVFDIRGRKIRELRKAMPQPRTAVIAWDGLDNTGRRARIGLYVVLLEILDADRGVILRDRQTLVLAAAL